MPCAQLELRSLRTEDRASFEAGVREFNAMPAAMPFAFQYRPGMRFAEYVAMVNAWPQGRHLPDGFVPNTFLVGVVCDLIVGRLSLRHRLNDYLERIGGHIGYAVVPSQRRRGFAKKMLQQALGFAGELGIQRVLVTCDVDNPASMRVIEANGGVFENITDEPELKVQKRRYWIEL